MGSHDDLRLCWRSMSAGSRREDDFRRHHPDLLCCAHGTPTMLQQFVRRAPSTPFYAHPSLWLIYDALNETVDLSACRGEYDHLCLQPRQSALARYVAGRMLPQFA